MTAQKRPHMERVQNYLRFPIQECGFYGDATDYEIGVLRYLMLTSQAVFNVLAIVDPRMHEMQMSAEAARQHPVLRNYREQVIGAIVPKVYRTLQLEVQPGLTLENAVLKLKPECIRPMMRRSPDMRKSALFANPVLRQIILESSDAGIATTSASIHSHWVDVL